MIIKLNSIRGFVSFYVFIHHFIFFTEIKTFLSPIVLIPFKFGQEAVMIFFFLSGFVIHFSSIKKNQTFYQYMFKRIVRIYPIFIVSMIISILVFYCNGYHFKLFDLYYFFGNLLMLQDINNKPGVIVNVFLQNHALWSLGYEFFFYIIYFPLIRYFDLRKQIYFVLLISISGWLTFLFFPNHFSLILSYMIIWWSGVFCAQLYISNNSFSLKCVMPMIKCLTIITFLSFIPILEQLFSRNFNFSLLVYPLVITRHFLFAIIIVLMGHFWWKSNFSYFNIILGKISNISSISYGLYLIHFPIIFLEFPRNIPIGIVLVIKVILIFLLSFIMEMKIQPYVNQLFRNK